MSTNANVKVELLDKRVKALTELIKKQEQKIQDLTRRNQVLENLVNLRQRCRCKCISPAEWSRAHHGEECGCSDCFPAGN